MKELRETLKTQIKVILPPLPQEGGFEPKETNLYSVVCYVFVTF